MVKCPNFEDGCDWTGELREALVHETECCKNKTLLNRLMDAKLDHLLNRMAELETNAKNNILKLAEKDQQIENLITQMENQNRETVNQNKKIEGQAKQIDSLVKATEDQNKQIFNQNKRNEDQSKQIENLAEQLNVTHQCKMIIHNIEDETDFSPICTIFQWKFKPTEIRSGDIKLSPPFYNSENAHCFQLKVKFVDNKFYIVLYRYRGKYDHLLNEIKVKEEFIFEVKIFGKNGKLRSLKYYNNHDYSIAELKTRSLGWMDVINNDEIGSLTDAHGYVNLHCSFNKAA